MSEFCFRPKIKLSVTVDDLFLWKGLPWSQSYSPETVVPEMTAAFARHDLRNVYGFSSTAAAEDSSLMQKTFDHWVENGHRIGNHTHYHANLNWVNESQYIRDIERTAEIIEPWINEAPVRYFRYAMDNWGNTSAKYDGVQNYLAANKYTSAPVNVWFYDTEFLLAHVRVTESGDKDVMSWLRNQFVDCAMQQLKLHVSTAREIFGRDPIYIWLIHATPLAADCLDEILVRFQDAGIEFVDLEDAMDDPLNQKQAPLITERFLNLIQKWAVYKNIPVEEAPPAILNQVESLCPIEGLGYREVMTRLFQAVANEAGGKFSPKIY